MYNFNSPEFYKSYKFTIDFINTNFNKIDFLLLSEHADLTEDVIDTFKHSLFFKFLSKKYIFSDDFFKKNHEYIWLITYLKSHKFSMYFIRKFSHILPLYILCEHQDLDEDFIKKSYRKHDGGIPDTVLSKQKLSNNFIRNIILDFMKNKHEYDKEDFEYYLNNIYKALLSNNKIDHNYINNLKEKLELLK